jgi:hypothetical protein
VFTWGNYILASKYISDFDNPGSSHSMKYLRLALYLKNLRTIELILNKIKLLKVSFSNNEQYIILEICARIHNIDILHQVLEYIHFNTEVLTDSTNYYFSNWNEAAEYITLILTNGKWLWLRYGFAICHLPYLWLRHLP